MPRLERLQPVATLIECPGVYQDTTDAFELADLLNCLRDWIDCSRRSGPAGFGVSALVRAVTAALFGVCEDI